MQKLFYKGDFQMKLSKLKEYLFEFMPSCKLHGLKGDDVSKISNFVKSDFEKQTESLAKIKKSVFEVFKKIQTVFYMTINICTPN
jgi:hypothetical protein